MSSTPVKIPSFYLDFMDSVNEQGHDSIIMRSSATSSDASCVELDIRLHSTHPHLKYMVALVDENAYFDHPKTGEALSSAVNFIELLGFPKDVARVDEFYLGPFNEDGILEIMAAADHTAGRLDLEERADSLQREADRLRKEAEIYGGLSKIHGTLVGVQTGLEKIQRREDAKKRFTVYEGGKSKVPKLA